MKIKTRKSHGFTLTELLVSMAIGSLVLSATFDILVSGVQQWNKQTSFGMSTSQATTAMDRIEREIREATAFSTLTVGGNTIYVFTLPANKDNGNYIPQRNADGSFQYVAGGQVAYYLSNTAGTVALTGNTFGLNNLWRASRASALGLWVPDTSWSMDNATQARYGNVTNLTMTTTGMSAHVVQVTLTLSVQQGSERHNQVLTRNILMKNAEI